MRGRVVDVPVHKGALEPHNFVGKREYGLNPKPGDRCALCMVPMKEHMTLKVACKAIVNYEGQHYQCRLDHPHFPCGHEFGVPTLLTLGHEEFIASNEWQRAALAKEEQERNNGKR